MRVVGQAVGGERLEARARPAAIALERDLDAAHRADEGQRARPGVLLGRVLAVGGQGAEEDRRGRVDGLDRRVGRADQAAVQVRCVGRAALALARVLRLQPQREVGLVPDDPAIDRARVAQRRGARELAEEVRARLVADVVAPGHLRGPHRSGARDDEHRAQPGRADQVHRAVHARPVIAGAVRIGGVEAGRRPDLGVRRRDGLPLGEDAHVVDPGRRPLGHRRGRLGVAGLVEHRGVVGDPGLQRRRGVRGGGHRQQDDGERGPSGGAGVRSSGSERGRGTRVAVRAHRPPPRSSRRATRRKAARAGLDTGRPAPSSRRRPA